jgi:hypothetical protein
VIRRSGVADSSAAVPTSIQFSFAKPSCAMLSFLSSCLLES